MKLHNGCEIKPHNGLKVITGFQLSPYLPNEIKGTQEASLRDSEFVANN